MFAGLIASLVLKTGLSPRVVKVGISIVGIAAAIGLGLLAWNIWLSRHDAAVVDRHETEVTAQVQTQGRAADQKLIERRDADLAAQAQARKEFDHATDHLPKSGLTARQRVDACRQLRRQGEPADILARAGCV